MLAYNYLNDFELISLLQEGDVKAYTEIFKRYNGLLFAHAYKKLGDKEEAKDIVQEVFTSLWNKHENMVINTNLAGYLYTVLRNRIYNILSHKRIESDYIKSLQNFLDQDYVLTDHLIREKQLQELIDNEIKCLPPRMRLIFEMSRKEYMSHEEIAVQLNISRQTVTDQIKKALRTIRPRITVVLWVLYLISK